MAGAKKKDISGLIGQKLLQGWTMLGEVCPNDSCPGVPLMRDSQKKVFLFSCRTLLKPPQRCSVSTAMSSTSAMATTIRPSISSQRRLHLLLLLRLLPQAHRNWRLRTTATLTSKSRRYWTKRSKRTQNRSDSVSVHARPHCCRRLHRLGRRRRRCLCWVPR